MSLEFWTTFVVGSYDDDDDDDVVESVIYLLSKKSHHTQNRKVSLSPFFVSDTLNVKNAKSVCDRWHLSLSLSLSLFKKKETTHHHHSSHIYHRGARVVDYIVVECHHFNNKRPLTYSRARACARSIKNNRALVQPPPRVYFFENRIFKREEEEKRISSGIFRFQTHPNQQQTNVR